MRRIKEAINAKRNMIPRLVQTVTKANGIFSDAHVVGRYIASQVGRIRIIRVTRSGTVIIECKSKQQRNEMMKMKEYEDGSEIVWFKLDGKPKRKGVISGHGNDYGQ